jgi:hypothetical protein
MKLKFCAAGDFGVEDTRGSAWSYQTVLRTLSRLGWEK